MFRGYFFIKIVIKERGPSYFYRIFLCKVFVLTCLKMAQVQAETCSIHVKVKQLK